MAANADIAEESISRKVAVIEISIFAVGEVEAMNPIKAEPATRR